MEQNQTSPSNLSSIIGDFSRDLSITFPEYVYLWEKWTTQDLPENEIISLSVAKSRGLKFYFTGVACKGGHLALRRVNGACFIDCCRLKVNEYRKNNAEHELTCSHVPIACPMASVGCTSKIAR
jgi:hypothetical protein